MALSDLLVPVTAEQVERRVLGLLTASGLPVMSWGPMNPFLRLVHNFCDLYADGSMWAAQLSNGMLLERSFGAMLKALARSQYNETKPPATFTEGKVLLVESLGAPQNILAGVHLFATLGNDATKIVVRATQAVTVPANGSIECTVRAVKAGASSNVANGAIVRMETSVPGVAVSNPPIGTTGTWITGLGTDVLTDAAFQEVCRSKWATLATGSPKSAYKYWALTTVGVSRAAVDDLNPGGPNTVWVYVDNALSLAALQTKLTAVQPAGTIATAKLASVTNIPVPGVVTVRAANRADAEVAIAATLVELASAAFTDIGGIIYAAEIIRRIKSVPGVVDFQIGSTFGTPNVQLGPNSYPQFTLALLYTEVA